MSIKQIVEDYEEYIKNGVYPNGEWLEFHVRYNLKKLVQKANLKELDLARVLKLIETK